MVKFEKVSRRVFVQDLNDEDYGNHSMFCVLFPTLLILSESSVVGRTHAFMRPIEKVARLPTAADARDAWATSSLSCVDDSFDWSGYNDKLKAIITGAVDDRIQCQWELTVRRTRTAGARKGSGGLVWCLIFVSSPIVQNIIDRVNGGEFKQHNLWRMIHPIWEKYAYFDFACLRVVRSDAKQKIGSTQERLRRERKKESS